MSGRTRTQALALAALAFTLVWSGGCGDARLTTSGDPAFGDTDRRPNRDNDADDGPRDASDSDEVIVPPPPDEVRCVLVPSVGGDIFVGVESAVQVGAYQFSIATGLPMEDERLRFEIVEDVSVPARLSSDNVRTNAEGLAAVRLSAGPTSGQVLVRVISECANPLEIPVDVVDLPTGNLRIGFNYPFRDIYDVSPVETYLYPADEVRCREITRGTVPGAALDEQTTRDVTGRVSIDGLRVDQEFTIVAVGRGRSGERAASGCVDAVFVRDGRTTDITIDLFLNPLDPVGEYDVLSHWDFRDAIADSGEVGRIIVQVLDVFDDPGRGIVNFIMDLVRDLVGGIISVAIDTFLRISGLDDVISDAINDVIASSPFLSDIVTIGRDLRAIIAELEVISDLSIGKLGSDFEVFGVDKWIGLALYWRLGCEPTDPPDCGRLPIVLDTLDLGLLRGDWRGRVVGYDRLDIDRHPIDFEYGRLILHILENVVLPAIVDRPGPVTLEDLMASIINCDGIGDFVGGGPGRCRCALGACICDADIENICTDFIRLTFGSLFRGFVSSLSFDAVLDIRGSCNLINRDEFLNVDVLQDGDYIGNIYIGEAPTPFVADFCGVSKGGSFSLVDECLSTR